MKATAWLMVVGLEMLAQAEVIAFLASKRLAPFSSPVYSKIERENIINHITSRGLTRKPLKFYIK
jgi:hypothetical protein